MDSRSTGVGGYDDALWKRYHATQGNEQSHEHIGRAGTPDIAVSHDCTVANNIVHHTGYTGIAITGVPGRKVAPRVAGNVCYRNMGGGIGSMSGATGAVKVVANDNKVSGFVGTAIVVRDSGAPAEVTGNVAISDDPGAKAVEITGPAGEVSGNELKRPAAKP